MTDLVSLDVRDGVAHLRLERPEASNAVDLPTAHLLGRHVATIADDDAVRAVAVTGAGKRFCAGGDVASFVAADDRATYITELATALDGALQSLAALEKPVMAGVHGAVAGAGLAVMLSCDLIVAEPGTRFVFAYPGIGLTPDCGLSYLLPRAVGQQRALHLALTGDVLDADRALAWGLVTEVVEGAQDRAATLATEVASTAPVALGQARRLLRAGWVLDRADTGAEEARTIGAMVEGDEARILIERFVRKD